MEAFDKQVSSLHLLANESLLLASSLSRSCQVFKLPESYFASEPPVSKAAGVTKQA